MLPNQPQFPAPEPQPIAQAKLQPEWRTPTQLAKELGIQRTTIYSAALTYKIFPVDFVQAGERKFYKIDINEPAFQSWLAYYRARTPKRKPYQRRDVVQSATRK